MKNLQVSLSGVSERVDEMSGMSTTQIILFCLFLVFGIFFMVCMLIYLNRKTATKLLRENVKEGKFGMTCYYRINESSDNIGEVLGYKNGLVQIQTIGGSVDQCFLDEISVFHQITIY